MSKQTKEAGTTGGRVRRQADIENKLGRKLKQRIKFQNTRQKNGQS